MESSVANSSSSVQARRWCFTVFEANLKEHGTLSAWFSWLKVQNFPGCKYIVAQLELAATERLHVQGYIHFTGQKRRLSVNNILHLQNLHLEMAKGTPSDNRAYCTEADKRLCDTEPFEFGECPGGQGSKLAAVAAMIKAKGLKRAIEESPATYITNGRGMRDLDRFYKRQKVRPNDVHVIVVNGDSGSGKTWWANMLYDPGHTFTMPAVPKNGAAWFDGYDDERTVVLDEFSGRVEYELFKNLCDAIPLQVPVKGDYTPAMWDTLIITTNNHPCTWYGNDVDPWGLDTVSPVQRRIHTYVEAHGNWKEGTAWYEVHSWITNTSSGRVESIPVRADEEKGLSEAVEPDTADAMALASGNASPTTEPDLEDEIIEELEGEDLDFLRGIELGEGADPDNIFFGTDGDIEPQFFTDLFDVV